jgi:hypothetical protein
MELNTRQEIITSIRGYFLTPTIATLAKKNFFKKNLNKTFVVKEKYLKIVINYLATLGFIKKKNNKFYFSKLGKKIFIRSGSFNIVHSYKDYLYNLDEILKKDKKNKNICANRAENIFGSGTTNARKFFNPTINLLKKNSFDVIHDLGCGNGYFLSLLKKKFSNKKISGSDLSNIALSETKKRFKNKKIKLLNSNAFNVSKWANWILKNYDTENEKILISMWFIIHEISEKNTKLIINFFKKINKLIPNAEILLGEIIEPDPKILNENKLNTIMPEYMFFHQLSGQGIFSIKEFKHILRNVPYKLTKQINIDEISYKNKKNPSGIVWFLKPKK